MSDVLAASTPLDGIGAMGREMEELTGVACPQVVVYTGKMGWQGAKFASKDRV